MTFAIYSDEPQPLELGLQALLADGSDGFSTSTKSGSLNNLTQLSLILLEHGIAAQKRKNLSSSDSLKLSYNLQLFYRLTCGTISWRR
ncbi:hypothetical protein [Vibrio sp. ED002]|uniref:hypothetical protein n=1 Tax=Vibrio sp. ED002 TaxID=2785123 RepID=UPI00200FED44|nr:hypothetical protein [Vibrio sp. ED002]UQA53314.1 hypothetical protein ITG12_26385 [Vibrio sp. ED002]